MRLTDISCKIMPNAQILIQSLTTSQSINYKCPRSSSHGVKGQDHSVT